MGEKGENAGGKHFPLFRIVFSKDILLGGGGDYFLKN